MNPHLTYMIARHRSAELQRARQQAQLADESRAVRKSPDLDPIIRASTQPARTSPRVTTTLETQPGTGSER